MITKIEEGKYMVLSSDKKKNYTVKAIEDKKLSANSFTCTCPAYLHAPDSNKSCKHCVSVYLMKSNEK